MPTVSAPSPFQSPTIGRLVMSAADYDLLDQQNPTWKPKRDMVATDGQKLTLGDTTLTLYLTPGHTEGTISTLIPIRDGGRPHLAAAWGGTLFNFGPNNATNVISCANQTIPLPAGSYQLAIRGRSPVALADNAGHVLDGDADGAAGGDFLMSFDVSTGANR